MENIDEIKTRFLAAAVEAYHANGTVAWNSKKMVDRFPLSPEQMDHILKEFESRRLIEGYHPGIMDSHYLFVFDTTPAADEFLKNGGYQEQALQAKKKRQLESDVANAAIRSADAAEESAREAKRSRNVAVIAAILALGAILQQCVK